MCSGIEQYYLPTVHTSYYTSKGCNAANSQFLIALNEMLQWYKDCSNYSLVLIEKASSSMKPQNVSFYHDCTKVVIQYYVLSMPLICWTVFVLVAILANRLI